MNKQVLDAYNIRFYKNSNKEKFVDIVNVVSSYLYLWKTIGDIDDLLSDINLCLAGNISSVEDTDYSNGLLNLYGELRSDELIISDETGIHWTSVPLSDFKELLLAWKEFLEQP